MKRQRGGRIDIVDLLYMYRKEGKNNTKKKKKKGSAAAAAGGLRFHHPFSSTLMGFWPYTRQKKKKKVSDSPVYIAEPIMLT